MLSSGWRLTKPTFPRTQGAAINHARENGDGLAISDITPGIGHAFK
jgi:hypothetical protein